MTLCHVAADLLWVVIYLTPAGTRDEGGVIQPAYINFDAALLEAPMHELKVSKFLVSQSQQDCKIHNPSNGSTGSNVAQRQAFIAGD